MTIKIKKLDKKYLDQAVNLARDSYKECLISHEDLPYEDFTEFLKVNIEKLFDQGLGLIALDGNRLIGYLAGYTIDQLWGKCKGIYCPLYGHGAIKDFEKKIYQNLYSQVSKLWVDEGISHHLITLYAHKDELINTWFWMGFGMRCVDAVSKVRTIEVEDSNIKIKKANLRDASALVDIDSAHNMFYKKAPIFMPVKDEDVLSELKTWLSQDNHHMWIAYDREKIIGYMRIQGSGERFISNHKDMMNITGAFIDENYRSKNIGSQLLAYVHNWLEDNNYKYCGVDYEAINVQGANFWNKHFRPYTYSLVRRIDERILK